MVADSGKTIQIRWFRFLFTLGVLMLLASVSAAGILYWLYDMKVRENEGLKKALAAYSTGSEVLRPGGGELTPEESGQEVTVSPAPSEKDVSPAEGKKPAAGDDSAPLPSETPPEAGEEAPSDTAPQMVSGVELPPVEIGDFKCSFARAARELRLRFNIRNRMPENGKVAGHVVLVLKPDGKKRRKWVALPDNIRLENGVPSGEEEGQTFSISKFRTLKFKLKNQRNPEYYKMASVYVFGKDDAGLLMQKDFPVETE
ncbi:hypothetical protein DENIS_2477 [Desulfonema ishimotonii]|uniref:Uncharacterized protein n=2 Tax=Desulfonema ishimotonii TaxID=45657 RepID=A0A401FX28_9BACT|nr:hypothetical protein DENIS_2477 [Desulfonema ishimotonii]